MQSMVIERLPICTTTGACQGAFLAPFVGVGDEGGSLRLQAQALDDVLRQDECHSAGVDYAVDGRASDVGLGAVAAAEVLAVPRVFERDVGLDLSHDFLDSRPVVPGQLPAALCSLRVQLVL